MNKSEVIRLIIKEDTTIIESMKQLDKTAKGILFVVDENNKLSGCLTDGDIRRWILKTGNLSSEISAVMNSVPKFVFEADAGNAFQVMKRYAISSLPILCEDGSIKDILFEKNMDNWKNQERKSVIPYDISVIIMAGGKGTRLYPYTKILPKPLIPIGDVPILERILERFFEYGVNEFYLTVNYKKEMIKSYFMETVHPYKLKYIEEKIPLGTAGSIRLIEERFKDPVIITNCDTLIDADYGKIVEHHLASQNDMTIVASMKNTVIQYGVLHTKEQGIVTSMEEKPQLSYMINTGMYVINPEFLDWIPEGRVFHMTDLVKMMIEKGNKVGIYPINENSFLDMGEFEEMKKMEEYINGGKEADG